MINTSQARLGPRRWPRRLAIAALALIVAAVAAIAFRPEIEDRLIAAFAERAMRKARAAAILPPDRMRVILCGTSAPIPSPRRAQRCTIVAAGGRFFVFDAGTGSWRKAQASGVPAERIEGIFLTHFHSDHIGDLAEFRRGSWVAGRAAPLSVFGPQSVEAVVSGVNQSLAADTEYRRALLAESHQKPSSWVGISGMWYKPAARYLADAPRVGSGRCRCPPARGAGSGRRSDGV